MKGKKVDKGEKRSGVERYFVTINENVHLLPVCMSIYYRVHSCAAMHEWLAVRIRKRNEENVYIY